MPLVQILLTLVFYVWLFLVLWLFWVISQRALQLLQLLIDTAQQTAEAALKTAKALEEPKKNGIA